MSKQGEFLKQLRKKQNLTQKELAEKLNVSDKVISKWEVGDSFPDYTLLTPLAEIFKVDVQEILNGEYKNILNDNNSSMNNFNENQNIKNNSNNFFVKNKTLLIISSTFILILICLSGWIFALSKNKNNSKNIDPIIEGGTVEYSKPSRDLRLVSELNNALAIDNAENGKHQTIEEVINVLSEYGFTLNHIYTTVNGSQILWDSKNDIICYYYNENIEAIGTTHYELTLENERYWVISDAEIYLLKISNLDTIAVEYLILNNLTEQEISNSIIKLTNYFNNYGYQNVNVSIVENYKLKIEISFLNKDKSRSDAYSDLLSITNAEKFSLTSSNSTSSTEDFITVDGAKCVKEVKVFTNNSTNYISIVFNDYGKEQYEALCKKTSTIYLNLGTYSQSISASNVTDYSSFTLSDQDYANLVTLQKRVIIGCMDIEVDLFHKIQVDLRNAYTEYASYAAETEILLAQKDVFFVINKSNNINECYYIYDYEHGIYKKVSANDMNKNGYYIEKLYVDNINVFNGYEAAIYKIIPKSIFFDTNLYDKDTGYAVFELDLNKPTILQCKVNPSGWHGELVFYAVDLSPTNANCFDLDAHSGQFTIVNNNYQTVKVKVVINLDIAGTIQTIENYCFVKLKEYPKQI